ncbi:flagellar basal body L-ring protein FlgH [Ramlibacter sp. G-1-2-2]|uniref:Flagellar L-ring protein n=1 Tax=Ramlibacter agri TaxID=2728837 RepID=A0A848H1Q3_9BURK|nr:flagellar basal body L-ring protein FlgH [Ramlibacter agri]NML43439.1 flagellar basal body L-ring protein FlgH [Ramlibacter agri]
MKYLPLLTALALAGCATVEAPKVDMHPAPAQPVAVAPLPLPTTGAIFNAASHRPLFEDRRARLAGDTLTIQIEETVTASQQSTTNVARNGTLSGGVTGLPYASKKLLGNLNVGANSDLSNKADGKTDSNNTFTGTITVTVQQVLPNGNLLVSGEKQIGVNQNVDVMRFSGIVNPTTIRVGNMVSSTQVADARLEQRGRGDVGKAQGLGWLSRFFMSIAPV